MKDERIYLRHIVEAIEDIESYTKSGYKTFTLERMRQDAVIRKLEVIGEAVKSCRQRRKPLAPRSNGERLQRCGIR